MATNLKKLSRNLALGFVQVTYIKKDGSPRTFLATNNQDYLKRSGVLDTLKGGSNNSDPNKHIVVFSVADNGFRTLIRESITGQRVAKVM